MPRLATIIFTLSFFVLHVRGGGNECKQQPVDLGDAAHFAVLAGSTITNTGLSGVLGDVGLSPGTAVTGFWSVLLLEHSSIHADNPTSAAAKIDLTSAYNDAAGRDLCPIIKNGDLGGMTLGPGLYKSTSSMAIATADLVLDAGNNGDAVWIFQMASTFVSAASKKIILANGAKASNIFWQVGSSGTLGADSTFEGTMMAYASITLGTGAIVNGRILAWTAAVTLLANVITLAPAIVAPLPGTVKWCAPHPVELEIDPVLDPCEEQPVDLGDAAYFAVLAGTTVTNSGLSVVEGDLGLSPGTAVTGFGPGVLVAGSSIHADNPTSAAAKIDLTSAYNDAAGRDLCPIIKNGDLGGMTLGPGLYKSTSSMAIATADLVLDAGNNGDAVWIFQMASTFVSAVSRKIILVNGAKASNIFWQVGSSGTIGAYSTFEGTMMAYASITLGTGAIVNGRVLARTAAVTLLANIITAPSME